jgi:tryptophan synthase alpha chain
MNRIERIFQQRRAAGHKTLMPFLTAGYPSIEATEAMLPAIERAGASIVEVGFPFSDPIADGPVIQSSMAAALGAGATAEQVLAMVGRVRSRVDLGMVAMVSFSIVYRLGVERFIGEAAGAGIDGFIFPDLPLEEAEALRGPVHEAGLTCSLLVAPTTPTERAKRIAAASSGFVYAVARTGITGESEAAPEGLAERMAVLREATDLPIAVGFGISRPEHVASVVEHADAAIVGSALVRQISEQRDAGPEKLAEHVGGYVAELVGGLGINR